jgi:hypothetical protein
MRTGSIDSQPPLGPGEERRRPRRGHPRTTFQRALEHDNLVLAEVTAREIGRVTIAALVIRKK